MKKVISLIMAVIMIASACCVFGSATEESQVKTTCGGDGNCETAPTIIVHGIGQSKVYLTDGNGNDVLDEDGDKITCFPLHADTMKLIKIGLVPILLTLITQHNAGLSKALKKAIYELFYMNISDAQGNESKYSRLEEYPQSVAECTEEEKATIYDNVPLEEYSKLAGEDHLYYFAYNSFGNNINIVDKLYNYIEMVKAETGHSKVNIVPISLGGTVANGLLEYYNGSYEGRPNVYPSINKIIYIVPALDGSSIAGDVFNLDLTFFDKEYLYNGFLETLSDYGTARWIEVALRILPDEVIEEILYDTCYNLVNDVIKYSTNMWALCPSADYPEAAKKWLSDPEMADIKAQTEMYYTAQCNSDANILKAKESGIEIFNIVDYDYQMYAIGNSYNKENTDGIIDLDSTSMGAVAANYGETLPEDYVQCNKHCTNPEHNHISPDRVVDASAGLLPDNTFYFDNQGHESTARNDIILSLATHLLVYDDIKDVYSSPDYPQFNQGRNTADLKNLLKDAEKIDRSTLTADQNAKLDAAIKEAEDLLATTVETEGHTEEVTEKFKNTLVEIGVRGADSEEEDNSKIPEKISLFLLDHFSTEGFSEYPFYLIKKLFSAIFK